MSKIRAQSTDSEQARRRLDRVKKFNEQTRWLPNSAFQTYYGRPAFENYGYKNTNPGWGGLLYGSYMKSFNVNPQRGENNPPFEQVYVSTQIASEKVDYLKDHMPRKCKDEYVHSQKEVAELKARLPLTIAPNQIIRKCGSLRKPELFACQRFMSKDDRESNEEFEIAELEPQIEQSRVVQTKSTVNGRPFVIEENIDKPRKSKLRPQTAKTKPQEAHNSQRFVQEEPAYVDILPKYKRFEDEDKIEDYGHKATLKHPKRNELSFGSKYVQVQLNPQNYEGLDPKFLQNIPYAGKHVDRYND